VKVGVSVTGGWCAVLDVDGEVNWIHKGLDTNKYRCDVVKQEQVNVRTGPGTRYAKSSLSPAHKYYSYRVIKRQGPWVKVKDQ